MSRGKKEKRVVFTLHFWLKRLCRINKDKNDINAITQIRDKTTNAAQDQI